MKEFDRKYRQLAFWGLVAVVGILSAQMLAPFISAMLWSVVLTVLLYPVYQRLRRRFSANMAAGTTTLLAILIIGVPLALIGAVLFVQVNGFIHELQGAAQPGQNVFDLGFVAKQLDQSLGETIHRFSPSFSFDMWYAQNKDQVLGNIRAPLTKGLVSAGTTGFMMVVALLTLFFGLRDGERLKDPIVRLVPLPRETTESILHRLGQTIHAVFISVVLVGIAQGLLAGAGYLVAGIPNAMMWTVGTIVLCMIPLAGAPLLYIPLSLILLAQGRTGAGLGLLAYCLIVVSNIDNLLKPWIIGSRVDLHPMAVFFALLGGIVVFGPVGLFAGPMTLSLALALYDVFKEMRASGEDAATLASMPEPAP